MRSNRTFMELKPEPRLRAFARKSFVLIVPLWN